MRQKLVVVILESFLLSTCLLAPQSTSADNSFVPYLTLGVPMAETVKRMQELSGESPKIFEYEGKLFLRTRKFDENSQMTLTATVKKGVTCEIALKSKDVTGVNVLDVATRTLGPPQSVNSKRESNGEVIIDLSWPGSPSKSLQVIYAPSSPMFFERSASTPDC